MQITFIEKSNIDTSRYDNCVNNALFECFYAQRYVLDALSSNWGICVYGDYEVVLPVAIGKKFIFKYIYQPVFTQYSAFLSQTTIADNVKDGMIDYLKRKFLHIHLGLGNARPGSYTSRDTFLLYLGKNSQELNAGFSKQCRKNIKNCISNNVEIHDSGNCDIHLNLSFELYARKNVKDVTRAKLYQLSVMLKEAMNTNKAELYIAFSNEIPIASAIFVRLKKKYIIYSATSETGRRNNAMYGIIHMFISRHTGEDAFLDFAGSSIDTIAYRNRNFGAEKTSYQHLCYSKLRDKINIFDLSLSITLLYSMVGSWRKISLIP